MVWVRDEGGAFSAPIDVVWKFVSSGRIHSRAHRHEGVRRQRLSRNSGRYLWIQPFGGRDQRFVMRRTAFPPTGIVYEVLDVPFRGSSFFLYYVPRGERTGVGIVGEFVSPTMPVSQVARAVRQFLAVEFAQDSEGIGQFDRR